MTESSSKTPSLLKIMIPVVVIILAVIGGLTMLKNSQKNHGSSAAIQTGVGSVIPDLDLKEFPSEKIVKFSSLKNKVTLLNFWASWCEACMVEIPSILKLRASFKDQGFDVIFLNVDQNPKAVLPKILSELKIDFRVFTDEEGAISEIFDVHAIPLTAILDQSGKILYIESGEKDWNSSEVRQKIAGWLKQ